MGCREGVFYGYLPIKSCLKDFTEIRCLVGDVENVPRQSENRISKPWRLMSLIIIVMAINIAMYECM